MNDRDAGSASLWALSMAMVLWVCVAAVVLAGVAVIARHRAATAADMAALAGASVVAAGYPAADLRGAAGGDQRGDPDGGARGCAAANAIAVANDATVTDCQVRGQVVDVTTSVRIPALALFGSLGLNSVSAQARAGPG